VNTAAGEQLGGPPDWLAATVARALAEDLGRGDVTTAAVVPGDLPGWGRIRAGQPLVLAGGSVVAEVFRQLDPSLEVRRLHHDGAHLPAGAEVARISGRCAAILAGERTALNFLQRLSGIATRTAQAVAATAGTRAVVMDTRKTTPGLRLLEKAAARAGGATSHRGGLDDGILIKDNHVACCGGSPAEAVRRALASGPPLLRIEVEIDRLQDLEGVLAAGADVVMLDNFSPEQVAEAVRRTGARAILEASGGISLDSIGAYAATGVQRISLGFITHSAPAADLGLELEVGSHADAT
jgi:nicotinate-nucleotide pyrophosphorylase (carboxylating)